MVNLGRIKAARDGAGRRIPQLARMRAHDAFDRLWRCGSMSRSEAYEWLTRQMGTAREFHMKNATVEECERVVRACEGLLEGLRSPVEAPDETADPWGLGYRVAESHRPDDGDGDGLEDLDCDYP